MSSQQNVGTRVGVWSKGNLLKGYCSGLSNDMRRVALLSVFFGVAAVLTIIGDREPMEL
jgi:hypothetical protein